MRGYRLIMIQLVCSVLPCLPSRAPVASGPCVTFRPDAPGQTSATVRLRNGGAVQIADHPSTTSAQEGQQARFPPFPTIVIPRHRNLSNRHQEKPTDGKVLSIRQQSIKPLAHPLSMVVSWARGLELHPRPPPPV